MIPQSAPRWSVWIDTGGTFTDCLARDPSGAIRRAKVLSSSALRGRVVEPVGGRQLRIEQSWGAIPAVLEGLELRVPGGGAARVEAFDPEDGLLRLERAVTTGPGETVELRSKEEAPVLATRIVTGTAVGAPFPPLDVRLATTRGTNALLERRGARSVLFITGGFRDILRIGTQQRPHLFELDIRRPDPLPACVLEVSGRVDTDGHEREPLDPAELRRAAERLRGEGYASAAVALMHADRAPDHERTLGEILRAAGFEHVSLSSELAPFIGLHARAETASVDAYLGPIIGRYLGGVRSALEGARLHVMTSAGGLVRAESFRARDSLLSGPAGGVAGAAVAGLRSGHSRVIAFDMGGTSTDVARWDGEHEYAWEHEVGGVRIVAPALAIESVAAGGGSVCSWSAAGLRVGPESAGAAPGPACYGSGGPLAVTDVNLLLGRISRERFGIPLDPAPAEAAAEALRLEVEGATGEPLGREALLEGLLEIANERMADAIRAISLRKGYDPTEYALVGFGGAGGQHACAVAQRLGIGRVLVPPDAGLLSAVGIGHAPVERFVERQILRPLEEVEASLGGWVDQMSREARIAVESEGIGDAAIAVRRVLAGVRFRGQDSAIELEWRADRPVGEQFVERYAEIYGHLPEDRPVEVVSLRVVAATAGPEVALPTESAPYRPEAVATQRAWFSGAWRRVALFDRATLAPGAEIEGPALIAEPHSLVVVEPGWRASVDSAGGIGLSLADEAAVAAQGSGAPEVIALELFTRRFESIVGEMGEQLRRTALSTNVKERLDFSCALLDPQGRLVANAPHIPVHLGALGLCVRAVRDAIDMADGDVVVTNHPAFGGSHLPDVTVITPVHDRGSLLGYVASRAHHAEIGGTRPGSMPPDARTLAEEGVVIPPMHLVRGGSPRWAEVRRRLEQGPHPSRAVDENLADLAAAVAAGQRGADLLRRLTRAHGPGTVERHMKGLRARAGARVRDALLALPDGVRTARERLDDGALIDVRLEISGDSAVFDLSGSGPVHPGNLNATPAIVRSVVLYVLRLLVREEIPLNEGLLDPVEIRLARGMLDPDFSGDPSSAPAVVGGNTEVSQRLTDTLLKALGIAACSQGTMNNVLWGDARFGYYETVCGGAGAGPGRHGASAVHTHMTNTRITDPELLEHRYPVRVERFEVRRGSGGSGLWRGGDGVIREITFLRPVYLSVLTQHRRVGPYGMEGGSPGATGVQRVLRASGETVPLGAVDGCAMETGDRLLLETPGGGGWGAATDPGNG